MLEKCAEQSFAFHLRGGKLEAPRRGLCSHGPRGPEPRRSLSCCCCCASLSACLVRTVLRPTAAIAAATRARWMRNESCDSL